MPSNALMAENLLDYVSEGKDRQWLEWILAFKEPENLDDAEETRLKTLYERFIGYGYDE